MVKMTQGTMPPVAKCWGAFLDQLALWQSCFWKSCLFVTSPHLHVICVTWEDSEAVPSEPRRRLFSEIQVSERILAGTNNLRQFQQKPNPLCDMAQAPPFGL